MVCTMDMTLQIKYICVIYTYILVLHFVYENGSNPAVGAASLALGLLRRSRPPWCRSALSPA